MDKKANNLPNLIEKLLPAQSGDVLELDEVQSFVQKKSNKSWLWIGLYRRTHQVVAYSVGARGVDTCQRLKASIPRAYCHVQMAMSSFLFNGMDFTGNFWGKWLDAARHPFVGVLASQCQASVETEILRLPLVYDPGYGPRHFQGEPGFASSH